MVYWLVNYNGKYFNNNFIKTLDSEARPHNDRHSWVVQKLKSKKESYNLKLNEFKFHVQHLYIHPLVHTEISCANK